MTLQQADTRMYVLTDVNANNNKFWEVSIDGAGVVNSRNGRVGSAGQSRMLGTGLNLFNAKIREKERKGYRKIDIVGAAKPGSLDTASLTQAAEEQIGRGDATITALVRELAAINRHQIIAASGGQMDVDLATGIVSTPLGVVTAENIERARKLLQSFERFILHGDLENPSYLAPLEEYLMLVPQKVGSRRGWHKEFITGKEDLTQQGSLLDQLESSIDIAKSRVMQANAGPSDPVQNVFDVTLTLSEDPSLRSRIEAFYNSSRQSMHASSKLKIARIFDVAMPAMSNDFQSDGASVGGVIELWHGTRAHNLLSILKSGLIIPKANGSIHITGRMFGNGIYFSDQSTKSLNYAYGYWDRGSRDDRCYMFLADVAMGRPWHPTQTGSDVKPAAGYDSVFARGGRDHVKNNEMIVYRTGQANLKHLVEFQA